MKRQENQKNEVIRRKWKDKIRKRKYKRNQQAAVDKNLPGVQARCAVFFLDGIQRNWDKKWWYSRIGLEIRTWKPVVVFIETRVFLVELKAFGLNSTKKNPVSMKPTHRFQVLTPKFHVKPSFFGPSFTETVNKKKGWFSLKTVILANFGHKTTIFWQKFPIFH